MGKIKNYMAYMFLQNDKIYSKTLIIVNNMLPTTNIVECEGWTFIRPDYMFEDKNLMAYTIHTNQY